MDDRWAALIGGTLMFVLCSRVAVGAYAQADRLTALCDPTARAWGFVGLAATVIAALAAVMAVAGLMALVDGEDDR